MRERERDTYFADHNCKDTPSIITSTSLIKEFIVGSINITSCEAKACSPLKTKMEERSKE